MPYANSNQSMYLLKRFAETVVPQGTAPIISGDGLSRTLRWPGLRVVFPFPYESTEFKDAVASVIPVPPGDGGGGGAGGASGSSSSSGSEYIPPSQGSSSGSSSGSGGSDAGSGGGSGGDSGSGSGSNSGSGGGTHECNELPTTGCNEAFLVTGLLACFSAVYVSCPATSGSNPLCACYREPCPGYGSYPGGDCCEDTDFPPSERCGGCGFYACLDSFCCYADGTIDTLFNSVPCACFVGQPHFCFSPCV